MSSFGVIVGAFVAGCAVMWSSSAFLSLPHDHANAMPTPEQRRATPPVPVRPESTPLATPFARPTVTAEIRAHQAAIAAVRTARLAAGSTECDTPPSLLPSREYSVPLTDAFGQSLNLESVSRPWAKGAPASVSFGPRAAAELQREPSTLDFLQYYVHLGQPFIVRK